MTKKEILSDGIELYCGDCRDILPILKFDGIITDPPYPNEYLSEYRYEDGCLESLNIERGLIFWTARRKFPLKFSTFHVWDKKISVGRDFELIYEIGGNQQSIMFRHYLINSSVAAMMRHDELTGHPSQKPLSLMLELLPRIEGIICDPFMGSGTTGVAAAKLKRSFIGIELQKKYFDTACRRISEALKQPDLFIETERKHEQLAFI